MLPTEFYLVSATTLLLWLFQHCSHEVIVLLIILGVLFIFINIAKLSFSVASLVVSLGLSLVRLVFKNFLYSYFSRYWQPADNRILPSIRDIVLRRIISDSNSESNNTAGDRINLPQYLAFHPEQWAAIEAAVNTVTTDSELVAPNSLLNSSGQLAVNTPNTPEAAPSTRRRSTRPRRIRNFHSS